MEDIGGNIWKITVKWGFNLINIHLLINQWNIEEEKFVKKAK